MPLVKVKPTSSGRRHLVKVVAPQLHKGPPLASLPYFFRCGQPAF